MSDRNADVNDNVPFVKLRLEPTVPLNFHKKNKDIKYLYFSSKIIHIFLNIKIHHITNDQCEYNRV